MLMRIAMLSSMKAAYTSGSMSFRCASDAGTQAMTMRAPLALFARASRLLGRLPRGPIECSLYQLEAR